MGKNHELIALANEKVGIVQAYRLLGYDIDFDGVFNRSRKVHCPFGELYHSDAGATPAMRLYPDTNSAWCFSCARYFTPTRMCSQVWDCDETIAADTLLDRTGYRPSTLEAQFQQLVGLRVEVDITMLAEALKIYCSRLCLTWTDMQFDPVVADRFDRCLQLLDLVHDEAGARLWLDRCKQAMTAVLLHPDGVPVDA